MLVAGYGLLGKFKWVLMVSMVSQGMLLYTGIASGEYYAQYRSPIVRNGKKATVGYQPDVWKEWE